MRAGLGRIAIAALLAWPVMASATGRIDKDTTLRTMLDATYKEIYTTHALEGDRTTWRVAGLLKDGPALVLENFSKANAGPAALVRFGCGAAVSLSIELEEQNPFPQSEGFALRVADVTTALDAKTASEAPGFSLEAELPRDAAQTLLQAVVTGNPETLKLTDKTGGAFELAIGGLAKPVEAFVKACFDGG